MNRAFGTGRTRAVVLVVAAVAVLAAVAVIWLPRGGTDTAITAYFDRAVGLYAGSDVRVLGMKVGRVDRVTPSGPVVRVDMTVAALDPIPAGASAVIVAPSLVSDRYVQLTPAYLDGPQMTSGAVIPRERTATPVEIDELLRSVDNLAVQLGPTGANRTGALSGALNTAAANLRGNGATLNSTLTQLGALASTLSESRGDLFATVENLNKFTATLAEHDAQVRDLESRLASVTGYLGDQHQQVGDSLSALADALGKVNSFIQDNRGRLTSNLDNLAEVSQALANERAALADVVQIGALGASNYVNVYDSASRSVAVRGEFPETQLSPVTLLCTVLQHYSPQVFAQLTQACVSAGQSVDKTLGLPTPAQALSDLQAGKPPLPAPMSGGHR
ncbi:MAG TPA: MCE family protein [Pseudonocardia sp.]|jgi:virulence factor Mce-like protein